MSNNLKKDLTQIAERLRGDDELSVALYGALCNMQWCNREGVIYSCTWRYAGGLVAELRCVGEDYMAFYCSGGEGAIDTAVQTMLGDLGWAPLPYCDEAWGHSGGRTAQHWNNQAMDALAHAVFEELVAEGEEECTWDMHDSCCKPWVHAVAAKEARERYEEFVGYFFESIYGWPDWQTDKLMPPTEDALDECAGCNYHTKQRYPAPVGWDEFDVAKEN